MVTPLQAAKLEPSAYGLVNPKTLVDEPNRWDGGFEQESVACRAEVNVIDICNTAAIETFVTPDGSSTLGEYKPFAVQAIVSCSTMGSGAVDWEQRAIEALEACTPKAVELEFWEGRLARKAISEGDAGYPNRYLGNGDAVDVTPTPGTAVKVRYGLALLESALADAGCGIRGFIHTPVSVGSVLPIKDRDNDGVLTTALGNYVIPGVGYTGTGTDGAAAAGSSVWLYATGPVTLRLGKPVVTGTRTQSIDSSINTMTMSAERSAAVVWDGCAHFKVLVDLSLDYA